jgi:hypothetical protein
MTRFLAVYYGDYFEALREAEQQRTTEDPYGFVIGPVRSGRVAYEDIKTLYPNAKLVIRNAAADVLPVLSDIVVLNAENPEDVNSAGLRLSDLEIFPLDAADPADYAGLIFNPRPPAGGREGRSLDIIYNLYDYVGWQYDQQRQLYLRYQDKADETDSLYPATDRLSGQQLAFENVIVLFTDHAFENEEGTILKIGLALVRKRTGLLFRDGRLYDVSWATTHYRLNIQDRNGNPLPLKPGRTFFEVVSFETTWDEGGKMLRFHSPPLPTRPTMPPSTATATIAPLPASTSALTSVPLPVYTPTEAGPTPTDTPTPTPGS